MRSLVKFLGVASILLMACALSDEPGTGTRTLPQGLSVVKVTDSSINLAYRSADAVIYLSAVMGQPTPEMYRNNPGSPRFEVDARFDADNGRTFYSRRGGDNWIDPSWPKDLTRQNDLPPTRVSDKTLFYLAAEATQAMDAQIDGLIGTARATKLAPALQALREFGAKSVETYVRERVKLDEHFADEGLNVEDIRQGEVAYGTPGPEDDSWHTWGANYYYIAVHDMSIAAGFGRHSATRLYAWSGAWVAVHDACNHGDCASTMGQKCFLQYYEALDDYKPTWTFQNCATGYDWDSDDGHNCHDDTRLQMNNFVYGGSANYGGYNNGYQGWCNDGDSDADISCDILFVELDQDGSPECNGSTNKGYNHPSWSPYQAPAPTGGGACDYQLGCNSYWMGVGDGCDCQADGSSCGDSDCGPLVACDYQLGCNSYWMGVGDGCDCQADGSSCGDPDCG